MEAHNQFQIEEKFEDNNVTLKMETFFIVPLFSNDLLKKIMALAKATP